MEMTEEMLDKLAENVAEKLVPILADKIINQIVAEVNTHTLKVRDNLNHGIDDLGRDLEKVLSNHGQFVLLWKKLQQKYNIEFEEKKRDLNDISVEK